MKEFAITSDGEMIENPKYLRKSEKRLRKLQKDLSRCKKGSKNREKCRIKVAKQHEKIANQRKDFLNLGIPPASSNDASRLNLLQSNNQS